MNSGLSDVHSGWRGTEFNGKESDLTSGWRYYGARYYEPIAMRWASADPLYRLVPELGVIKPATNNLYTFSVNNPLTYLDPDGRTGQSQFADAECTNLPEARQHAEEVHGAKIQICAPGDMLCYATFGLIGALFVGGVVGPGVIAVAAGPGKEAVMTEAEEGCAGPAEEQAGVVAEGEAGVAEDTVSAEESAPAQSTEVGAPGTPRAGGGASLSNISPGATTRIQNAANRLGVRITLVGSRAGGSATAFSDWDYIIQANSRTIHSAISSLPGASNLLEKLPANIDIFRSVLNTSLPHIIFDPE